MNKKDREYLGYVFFIYLFIVAIKVLLSPLIKSPGIFGDEAVYFWMAKAPLTNHVYIKLSYPPLYPISISLSHILFDTVHSSFLATKVINSFLSTTVIFPTYYLANLFLKRRESLFVSFLSTIIPLAFIGTFFIVSENLFYPIFILSVYLIIKSEIDNSIKYTILSGVVISLAILTRPLGLILIVGYLFLLFLKIIYRENISRYKYVFIPISITLVPYFVYKILKYSYYDFYQNILFGQCITEQIKGMIIGIYPFFNVLRMFISHFDYLTLASGIFFMVFSISLLYSILQKRKRDKLTTFTLFSWVTIFTTLSVSSIFLLIDIIIISRYVFFVLPLLFIMGLKFISTYISKRESIVIGSMSLVVPLMLFMEGLDKAYLPSITSYSYISSVPVLIVIGLSSVILLLLFLKMNNIKRRRIFLYVSVLFVSCLFLLGNIEDFQERRAISIDAYNKSAIGRYVLNNNINDVIFDEDDYKNWNWYYYGIMFWSDNRINKGDINNSKYIITSKQLNETILAMYQVNDNKPPRLQGESLSLYRRSKK